VSAFALLLPPCSDAEIEKLRIALANWTCRRAGGVETYLNALIPELSKLGHEIGFYSEVDEPKQRARIELPENSIAWCAAKDGEEPALSAVRAWRPDILYCHKLSDPILERRLMDVAPSVLFAHDHDGTCISGTKAFSFPEVRSCERVFSWKCLVHYFPHRCGGLNPITMLSLYNDQAKRLENMKAYSAIVTHSDYMLGELRKHGLTAHRAYKNGPCAQAIPRNGKDPSARDKQGTEFTLVFSGRLEHLKGTHLLIDALPIVQRALNAPIRLVIAGDGRERATLERRAARIRRAQLQIDFAGWIERNELEKILASCDLLVVPSLWPEPFGLVGPEAGQFGVPVAAFDVGAIRDWLSEGVNGFLASGNPPSSKGLAEAILKCVHDANTHARLRVGAFELAQRFSMQNHLAALFEVFSNVTGRDFNTSAQRQCESAVSVA
jgi:glycosyltransferase involved in cell wall biosynthesis